MREIPVLEEALEELTIRPEVLSMVSYEAAQRLLAIPFDDDGDVLAVAMADPDDLVAVDTLRALTCREVHAYRVDADSIMRVLRRYHAELVAPGILAGIGVEIPGDSVEDSRTIQVVNQLLLAAVEKGASDMHLEPQVNGLHVRLRIDGVLHSFHTFAREHMGAVIARLKILANMDVTERRLPQDGGLRTVILDRPVDLRIGTLPARYGEKTVVRILDKSGGALDLKRLGLTPGMQGEIEMLVEKPQGMFLVTGPTGSGKTTTLYALINRIRSSMKNVLTLEDPIEYDLATEGAEGTGLTQVQIDTRTGLTFPVALRAALRQDPDVIMIGEIRDRETAEIAMRASMTGHLVFSTLHTNSAPETIGRLGDMGIERYLTASTVCGVLAQRLVRTLCPYCSKSYSAPARVMKSLFGPEHAEGALLRRPVGCARCAQTGYLGRIGLYEFMKVDEELAERIHAGDSVDQLRSTLRSRGVLSLRGMGLHLVKEGRTTIEEIHRVAAE